jgi:uncharacterized protein YndB with AHSA1/START domain
MDTTTTETTRVEREVAIGAAPETVWEFLVDPEKLTRWMGIDATIEPTPGGIYRVAIRPGTAARGEFVELDRPRRVVLTWGWEPGAPSELAPGGSMVAFDLVPDGDGTLLRLTHELPTAHVGMHGEGWEHYLSRLSVVAAGEDPGPDPWQSR